MGEEAVSISPILRETLNQTQDDKSQLPPAKKSRLSNLANKLLSALCQKTFNKI